MEVSWSILRYTSHNPPNLKFPLNFSIHPSIDHSPDKAKLINLIQKVNYKKATGSVRHSFTVVLIFFFLNV